MYMCVYKYVCRLCTMYVGMYVCMYIYICTCICMYVCTHVCIITSYHESKELIPQWTGTSWHLSSLICPCTGLFIHFGMVNVYCLLAPIREMALEDGRFLVSPTRYDKLLKVSKLTINFAMHVIVYRSWMKIKNWLPIYHV